MTRSVVLVMAGLIACVVPAHASPPSPANSQIDPCIVTCPAGDSVFAAILRDANGAPSWGGEEAEIDLCGCPDVRLAPVAQGGSYWIEGCTVWTLTDLDGVARFPLAAGGVCSGASIRVFCFQIYFATRTSVASFDQDGDLVVSAADLALISGKQGSSDPTADFNCDGMVTQADVDIATSHAGHHAPSIVGVGNPPGLDFAIQPVPNPSRGPMDFVLQAPAGGRAVLAIFDPAGRRVTTVVDREVEPGVMHLHWSGRDGAGQPIRNGLYFYRFTLASRRLGGTLIVAR